MNRALARPALLTAAAACLCGTAVAQDGPVSGAELRTLWSGKELVGNGANNARLFVRLGVDGGASFTSGTYRDTGTWREADNGYCTTWANTRAGQERCFTVVRSGSAFDVYNPDGSWGGRFTAVR